MGVSWKDEWFVKAFRLAGDGLPDRDIAAALGVPMKVFALWLGRKPALREGLAEARKAKGEGYADFRSFVYEKLPRKARELWDELDAADRLPDVDRGKRAKRMGAMEMIDKAPAQMQQSLFLHALVKCNFITSRACMKTGISPRLVQDWMARSNDFKKLVEGVIQHKKDFFESALIDLVRSGDSAATIFANKTLNKDRGYAPDTTIQIESTVVHKQQVAIDELPVDAQRAVLYAIRRKAAQLEDRSDVVDAEIVED